MPAAHSPPSLILTTHCHAFPSLHPPLLPPPHTHSQTGQRYEARLDKSLLPLISLGDVNERAARLTHTHSAVFKSVEHRWGVGCMGCVCVGGYGWGGGRVFVFRGEGGTPTTRC